MSQNFDPSQPDPGAPTPESGETESDVQRAGGAMPSLFLGSLSVIVFCAGLFLGIPALILGLISLKKIKASGGQLAGRGLAIAGTGLGALGSLVGVIFLVAVVSEMKKREPVELPQARFEVAEDNLRKTAEGVSGFGNSPKAVKLAERFAARMKAMEKPESAPSASHRHFRTHCELSPGKCAFIVSIPDWQEIGDEAREKRFDRAWKIAEGTLAEAGFEDGVELAVGLRSEQGYESIMLGTFAVDGKSEKRSLKIEPEPLMPFFPDPAEDSNGEVTPGPDAATAQPDGKP